MDRESGTGIFRRSSPGNAQDDGRRLWSRCGKAGIPLANRPLSAIMDTGMVASGEEEPAVSALRASFLLHT